MARQLNFQKVKKEFLTITFNDDRKILVRQPTKKIMDQLGDLGEAISEVDVDNGEATENNDRESLDIIYGMCAQIMTNNMAKERIEVDYLSEALDVEDLILFFNAYTEFIGDLDQVKN